MSAKAEIDGVPKLDLADLDPTEIPHLEVIVRNSKSGNRRQRRRAACRAAEPGSISGRPSCTSDAGAHAIMGSVSDPRGAVEFRFYRAGASGDYVEILSPESPRVANVRLAVTGWGRSLHHVVFLDRSGELLLAPDNEDVVAEAARKNDMPHIGKMGRGRNECHLQIWITARM